MGASVQFDAPELLKRISCFGVGCTAAAAAVLSVELLMAPAVAHPGGSQALVSGAPMLLWGRHQQLSEAQQQALFRAQKAWKQTSYARRAALMKREKQCVARAADALTLRDCLQQSRQSRTALREQYYAYINPIRQQLGLKPLQWVRHSAHDQAGPALDKR